MARRQLIARTKKKARVTKSETWLVNHKYLGDEPDPKKFKTQSDVAFAFTWYGSMCTVADARQYLKDYLISSNEQGYAKKIDKIPDAWVPLTWAWKCRMVSLNGAKWDLESYTKFLTVLDKAISRSRDEIATDKPKTDKPNIQDRMRERASDILGEIEGIVDQRDELPDFSLYDWLKKKEIPVVYASMIPGRYAAWLHELIEAAYKSDEQVVEAYVNVSKKKLDYDIKFFNMLIEDAERYADTTKKIRKPRKPRTISVEKKLKSFKYQKEDSNFKIASVSPEKIIGCQELWTFNTKYKTLTVLRAIDRGGIQVKGTSFTGYDEKNSVTKRTGRKPEQYVDKVLNGGKIVLRKLMDEIKGEAQLAYRSNENTILLRVVQ